MLVLRQKEFNSKAQKKLRRYYDYKKGAARIDRVNPDSAEAAFLEGKAMYPGEKVNRVFREGDNWHYKTQLRNGVSPEKAKLLESNAANMRNSDPKRWAFHKGLVAGRNENLNKTGYADDLSNINHRINARGIGEEKEALDAGKEILKKKKLNNPTTNTASKAAKVGTKKATIAKNAKLLKRVGIGAAAVAGTAGLAYGAKKLYDKKKKEE